ENGSGASGYSLAALQSARAADPNAAERSYGHTALMWAAAAGHVDVARLLLDAGASANARSTAGDTPLHFAAAGGDAALIDLLLERGADPGAVNAGGRRPIDVALAQPD